MSNVPARIEALEVRNFRVLKDVKLTKITPLTVLTGPNGSGKSTIFDVFAFLSECFETSLRHAWDKRGCMREIRSRGADGPVRIRIKYREKPRSPLITYNLAIDEQQGKPEIVEEWLQWRRGIRGKPFKFLDVGNGRGKVIAGEAPEDKDELRIDVALASSDLLAVNTLGQLKEHPRVVALRNFITGWYVSHIAVEGCREQRRAGPQERLSRTGDNLGNVIQYLLEYHPDHLDAIFKSLRRQVPRIEKVIAETMANGRLLLQVKDKPFNDPILADFASDGTLKMLAYLIILNDPMPPAFVGIEEPENFLHPQLLQRLAETCGSSAENAQILVTTHSPYFVNALQPKEVRVLWRNKDGFASAVPTSEITAVPELVGMGTPLGYLWMQGHLGGNPMVREGAPPQRLA